MTRSRRYRAAQRRLVAGLIVVALLAVGPPAQAFRSPYCGHRSTGFFNVVTFTRHYDVGNDDIGWKHFHVYDHATWYGWEHLHWRTRRCPNR